MQRKATRARAPKRKTPSGFSWSEQRAGLGPLLLLRLLLLHALSPSAFSRSLHTAANTGALTRICHLLTLHHLVLCKERWPVDHRWFAVRFKSDPGVII